ncbi:MAG: ERCC4 domain-containing protein [Sporichthyaceae bacterium]
MELVVARNPDPDSSLPYLLRLPIGLVFRVKETWPRTAAVFCYPVPTSEWPAEPDVVERVPLVSCERRGAAIDVVADRAREQRSQIVFTKARGRDMVFWQGPRTRRQARPQVKVPTARAAGAKTAAVDGRLDIVVDTRERYAFAFADQQVSISRRALRVGDYAVLAADRVVAAVERKSLPDLATSLLDGKLRFAMTELAALPRAAVVVEERYSAVFGLTHQRPAAVADALAELQVRWPAIPIAFCDNRKMAQEWTYRFLAAAAGWAHDESAAVARMGQDAGRAETTDAPLAPAPGTAELRAWARSAGLDVPDRGRLRPEILQAWRAAQT